MTNRFNAEAFRAGHDYYRPEQTATQAEEESNRRYPFDPCNRHFRNGWWAAFHDWKVADDSYRGR